MELKKSPKTNLERYKVFFYQAGLALSLVAMLVAFEWGSTPAPISLGPLEGDMVDVDHIPITITEPITPIPPAPKPIVSDVLVIVETPLSFDVGDELFISELGSFSGSLIVIPDPTDEEIIDEPLPPTVVSTPAQFMGGGVDVFRNWIAQHMQYPELAIETATQGKVIVQFVIDKTGKVVNAKVLRGVDPLLDKEAIRVITSSPQWTPGEQRGKPVRVVYTMPVVFKLDAR